METSFKEWRDSVVKDRSYRLGDYQKHKAYAIESIHQLNWEIMNIDVEITKLFDNQVFAKLTKKKQELEKKIRKKEKEASKFRNSFNILDAELKTEGVNIKLDVK